MIQWLMYRSFDLEVNNSSLVPTSCCRQDICSLLNIFVSLAHTNGTSETYRKVNVIQTTGGQQN